MIKSFVLVVCVLTTTYLFGQNAAYYDALNVQDDYSISIEGARMEREGLENLYRMAKEREQQEYQRQLELAKLKKAENDRNERLRIEKARNDMKMYKEYYNSMSSYPTVVKDGWHSVIAMNSNDFCAERKVYVLGNKVVKYIVDDWSERTVGLSYPINQGKSIIQLNHSQTTSTLEILFLNYIADSSSNTTPPMQPGQVSFWVDFREAADIQLFFSGMYVGNFQSYFSSSKPNCGQSGTLTVTYKPGVYNYYAKSKESTWSGTVTITEGGCSLQGLTK